MESSSRIVYVDVKYLIFTKKKAKFLEAYNQILAYVCQQLELPAENTSYDQKPGQLSLVEMLEHDLAKYKKFTVNSTNEAKLTELVLQFIEKNPGFYYEPDKYYSNAVIQSLQKNYDVRFLVYSESRAKLHLGEAILNSLFRKHHGETLPYVERILIPLDETATLEKTPFALVTFDPTIFIDVLKFTPQNIIYVNSITLETKRKLWIENEVQRYGGFAAEVARIYQLQPALEHLGDKSKGTLRVGYAFAPKKLEEMSERNFLKNSTNYTYIPIDLRCPLNREVDIVIQKVQQYRSFWDEETWKVIEKNVQALESLGKILIDPFSTLEIVMNRLVFQEKYAHAFASEHFTTKLAETNARLGTNIQVRVPKMLVINPNVQKPADVAAEATNIGLRFPAIFKIKDSSSSANSHKMAIAVSLSALEEVEASTFFKDSEHIIQELIPHDQEIHKIYAIGMDVRDKVNGSLPNITKEVLHGKDWIIVDSQKPFADQLVYEKKVPGKKHELVMPIIQLIADVTVNLFSVSIFGIDIIVDSLTGDYYLVDLNYFPGFKGIPDFVPLMERHISSIYNAKKGSQAN